MAEPFARLQTVSNRRFEILEAFNDAAHAGQPSKLRLNIEQPVIRSSEARTDPQFAMHCLVPDVVAAGRRGLEADIKTAAASLAAVRCGYVRQKNTKLFATGLGKQLVALGDGKRLDEWTMFPLTVSDRVRLRELANINSLTAKVLLSALINAAYESPEFCERAMRRAKARRRP